MWYILKFILIFYAIIGIIIQLVFGQLTGLEQGSIGLLTFIFLVEIDPRFKYAYILPNIKQKKKTLNGENNE